MIDVGLEQFYQEAKDKVALLSYDDELSYSGHMVEALRAAIDVISKYRAEDVVDEERLLDFKTHFVKVTPYEVWSHLSLGADGVFFKHVLIMPYLEMKEALKSYDETGDFTKLKAIADAKMEKMMAAVDRMFINKIQETVDTFKTVEQANAAHLGIDGLTTEESKKIIEEWERQHEKDKEEYSQYISSQPGGETTSS